MKTTKKIFKTTVLFLIFLLGLNTTVYSQSQGPNAPEAASFEPVDATDMVNLSTGDFTYVLPLLNVPSPEGGYPLALAYHAGIAMDQEASWVGLGWNLNPGAINRYVNGYPDDYKFALINEYIYDEGREVSIYNFSLGYSNGTISVGLGLSWGSNRSLGGYVSVGYGFNIDKVGKLGVGVSVGTEGVGMGVSLTTVKGFSVGLGVNSEGDVTGSAGFMGSNGLGFDVSTNGNIGLKLASNTAGDKQTAIGLTFSSRGVSLSVDSYSKNTTSKNTGSKKTGIGLNLQFANTVKMNDYVVNRSGWQIPLTIPTPIGVFSLSFGKQKIRYYLGKNENDYVFGPLYFSEEIINNITYKIYCACQVGDDYPIFNILTADDYQKALSIKRSFESRGDCSCKINEIKSEDAFMDIYEVPIEGNQLSEITKVSLNNAVFPAYDNYNIQAQGLSGGMSPTLFDNGALFGLTGRENDKGFSLKYAIDGSTEEVPLHAKFNGKAHFYLNNEISRYYTEANVAEAVFRTTSSSSILAYFSKFADDKYGLAKERRKTASYVEYFSNEEIIDNPEVVKAKGYLKPYATGFNRKTKPLNGIGAFKITTVDGKTYHYSLPVYNHEVITRTFGLITSRPNESQSYFEKRQLEPYATHWLLTAVTGPDYYDTNKNGSADSGDYGYWVAFDYGKWSDAFIWKNPYGKSYLEDSEDPKIKTSIIGRKEVYYLDKVITRTHTALFYKSKREDGYSQPWNYKSVEHINDKNQNSSAFKTRFSVPIQNSLQLDYITLVKNADANVSKSAGGSSKGYVDIHYNNSKKPVERAYYQLEGNVLDSDDYREEAPSNTIKTITLFYYSYLNGLVKGSPNTASTNTGRLSLKRVAFSSEYGDVMPPYVFEYDNTANFDIDKKDFFGYVKNNNKAWSLNKIHTPTGGEISIKYSTHNFENPSMSKISAYSSYNLFYVYATEIIQLVKKSKNIKIEFNSENQNDNDRRGVYFSAKNESTKIWLKNMVRVGDKFDMELEINFSLNLTYKPSNPLPGKEWEYYYKGTATVNKINNGKYYLKMDGYPQVSSFYKGKAHDYTIMEHNININQKPYQGRRAFNLGGIRVSSITTSDGNSKYRNDYKYGKNDDGVGFISYLPFESELQNEMPYSAELPFPKVMYEYVSMERKGVDGKSEGKTTYKFKVFKKKDKDKIKFGDLYEIKVAKNNTHQNTSKDKEVNISSYIIKDNLASLGSLLEVANYNGSGQLLGKIKNEYYSPGESPDKLGMSQESYQSYKTVDYNNKTDKWLINSTTRIKYPALLKKSTEYKMGSYYTSEYSNFNSTSGLAKQSKFYSSEGLQLKSKTVYAHEKYEQMGSKAENVNNFNMLSQEAKSAMHLIDPVTDNEKVIGISISTWNNLWNYKTNSGATIYHQNQLEEEKVWRKHKNYVWTGELNKDGTYKDFVKEEDKFNWGVGAAQTNQKWQLVSEVSLYDRFSSVLEVKDLNDNYASKKMGDKHSKIIVNCNSKYDEMYYSGAEYKDGSYFDGGIKSFGHKTVSDAHTGSGVVEIGKGQNAFEVTVPARASRTGAKERFKLSVWLRKGQELYAKIRLNGVLVNFEDKEKIVAGNWVLLTGYINLSGSKASTVAVTSTQGTIQLDDFRLHPVASTMNSYVYNSQDELSFITEANGLSTQYIYDDAGKLIEIRSEVPDNSSVKGGFKKVNTNDHNYKKTTKL
ncbi:MAG: hypothetical protein ACK5H1_08955 [Tenacibaculum sp.]